MSDRPPEPQDDAAERWGRLIGRTLGYGFALLLLLNLLAHWF